MKNRRLWIVPLAAVTVLTCTGAGASGEAGASTQGLHDVAVWEMNENAGARTMYDSTGNGNDGRIGGEVGTGTSVSGARGYRFAKLEPDTPPTHPRHLVMVPDNEWLNPDSDDFAVTLRLRTTYQFGNIIQKGQATVPGGSWKLQIPNGHVQCWFRGSSTSLLVTAQRKINDGKWHVIRCERSDEGVVLAIDGSTVAYKYGWTGDIANSWPLSIGGKSECDQIEVGCDYFAGDIDYVAIER
jgi:hypothetical protein